MSKQNFYWSVYKNLEKEVLALSDVVHFDDKQLTTYSMHIGTLIIRCVVEIESISKELYAEHGGKMEVTNADGSKRDLFFDTDCIAFLSQKWLLEKKIVNVVGANFYFKEEYNTILHPLKKAHKRGNNGSDWKQAYQAIKHDRANSIEKASLKNLIRSLAALYLLNLYYKNETFFLNTSEQFDCTQGSSIFSVELFDTMYNMSLTTKITDTNIHKSDVQNKAVFVKKYDDRSIKEIEGGFQSVNQEVSNFCATNKDVLNFIAKNPGRQFDNSITLIIEAGGVELLRKCFQKGIIAPSLNNATFEVICNTHKEIYPVG